MNHGCISRTSSRVNYVISICILHQLILLHLNIEVSYCKLNIIKWKEKIIQPLKVSKFMIMKIKDLVVFIKNKNRNLQQTTPISYNFCVGT